MLALFDHMADHGLQMNLGWPHSPPPQLLKSSTIAAVRRLQRHGVVVRSQTPS